MASIEERRNKAGELIAYRIVVSNGSRQRGKLSKTVKASDFPDTWSRKKIYKELDKIAVEFEDQCKKGIISSEKKTFEEYAEYVIALKERNGIKPRTIYRYRELMERITDKKHGIGNLKLTEIRPDQLNDFYAWLSQPGQNKNTGKELSNKTIIEHHRLIHTVLAQAYKEGAVNVNVADRATPPKMTKTEADYYEPDTIAAILEALEDEPMKWQACIYTLIGTGARRGEVLGLTWNDIDFEKSRIHICKAAQYLPSRGVYITTTKTNNTRYVSIPRNVAAKLQAWREELEQIDKAVLGSIPENGFVFPDLSYEKPMHPDTIGIFLDRFSKRHNLPHLHPHGFRHSQASMLINAGVDILTISKRLGHEKVSTTQDIYGHLLAKADEGAASELERMVFSTVPIKQKGETQGKRIAKTPALHIVRANDNL